MLSNWTAHKARAVANGDTLKKLEAEERSELSDSFLSRPLTSSVAGLSHVQTTSSKRLKATTKTKGMSKDLEAVASPHGSIMGTKTTTKKKRATFMEEAYVSVLGKRRRSTS